MSLLSLFPRVTPFLSKAVLPLSATRSYAKGPELAGSKTAANLAAAFAGESQANRRYLYFARQADVLGDAEVSEVFRSTADGETGHAFGHLEYLATVGDPATGMKFSTTADALRSAIAGETHEYVDMYPTMAKEAREEGYEEIEEWFQTLAMAEKSHAGRFQRALDKLEKEQQ
mmetsp:Transcript_41398/g.104399  ORF Transcript_41398/g.104399 Transcript_41398/m.104399 type:complete len:173 (-) Transcript_41398:71-589(-)|eukprot:CAMPEP_0177632306 /NCGR_PEP_ID=MMETSP0447-20121125/2218_1 /TAXON_ID=0 /ORGANISM="Stygamoeba regulata, Strain BSH-02190019" /LENGTH=172 /DNA_ID=CAMNT_0019133859 /DNA_START=58 /DNA_END=576 /DNA_ORIENTATION=+